MNRWISILRGGGYETYQHTNKSKKFSVLMSVYFKEKPEFFELSLKSNIEFQNRKPDEFVLVCDGPLTEDLDLIIDRYQSLYPDVFKVYRTKENQGLGKALNYGLQKCSYDIVARSDSDDVCSSERFEVQIGYMEAHPEIAVCSSYIDEFEYDWTKPSKIKTMPINHGALCKMAKFRNPINHMASAFRKDVILQIGSYQHIPYVEDYELWVRTILNGYKLSNIDKVLVHARVGNGMVARRGNRQYITSWRKLSRYMLEARMINKTEYCRNMLAIRLFVYMPRNLKEEIYKKILRK